AAVARRNRASREGRRRHRGGGRRADAPGTVMTFRSGVLYPSRELYETVGRHAVVGGSMRLLTPARARGGPSRPDQRRRRRCYGGTTGRARPAAPPCGRLRTGERTPA